MNIPNTDPNGIADSTMGLQTYIDQALAALPARPSGAGGICADILVPPGYYKISAPLNLSGTTANLGKVGLRGSPGATSIFGTFDGYLVTKSNTAIGLGPSYIRDLHLSQNSMAPMISGCLDFQGALGLNISGCSFGARGGVCINLNRTGTNNVYATHINSCIFTGASIPATSTAIGILANGQVSLIGCDFTVFSEAIRLANAAYFISGSRFEVNKTAIHIGRDYANNLASVSHIAIAGIGMEANDICVNAEACQHMTISGIGGDGTGNAPSGMSQNGIILGGACGSAVLSGVIMHGNFTNNAIQSSSPTTTWINVQAGNGLNPTQHWVMKVPTPAKQFINCVYNIGNTVYPYSGQ